jgi:hypothetical protein
VFTPIAVMIGLAIRELKRHSWDRAAASKPTRHWGPLLDSDRVQFQSERQDGLMYKTHEEVDNSKNEAGPLVLNCDNKVEPIA